MTENKKINISIVFQILIFWIKALFKSFEIVIVGYTVLTLINFDFDTQELFSYLSTIDKDEIFNIFINSFVFVFIFVLALKYLLKRVHNA